jgi:hypothetical protein
MHRRIQMLYREHCRWHTVHDVGKLRDVPPRAPVRFNERNLRIEIPIVNILGKLGTLITN